MAAEAWLLGETKGFWINTGALVLSVLVAACTIYMNSKLMRKRATLDILMDRRRDPALMAAIHFINSWKKEGLPPTFVLARGTVDADRAAEAMNYYEFIALSIIQGALDEGMYKQMQCSNFLKFWNNAEPLVRVIRETTGRGTFYQDMEWLARRWSETPLRADSHRYLPPLL